LMFNEPNAVDRCRDLLREGHEVQVERERLDQKLRRLTLATEELSIFWGL
jgi:hypothetical protein